jgi:hypothetical protein
MVSVLFIFSSLEWHVEARPPFCRRGVQGILRREPGDGWRTQDTRMGRVAECLLLCSWRQFARRSAISAVRNEPDQSSTVAIPKT